MSIRLLISVFAFSWALSTAALAEPMALPLGMSVHGETATNELAEYLFEAEGPGMLSVAIRSENGEDIAFSVRAATGEAIMGGGEFDIDFNGNVGAEHAIIPLPVEGDYIVAVRPLGGNAAFVMGVSWLPFDEAGGQLIEEGNGGDVVTRDLPLNVDVLPDVVAPADPAEDAEPILLGEQVADSIVANEGETGRWYSYEADVDGVFLIIVHNSSTDMIIEGYNEGELPQAFARSDEDFGGDGGNEIILTPVTEGEIYYFRVAPLSGGGNAEFHVIGEIFPGAEVGAGAGPTGGFGDPGIVIQ